MNDFTKFEKPTGELSLLPCPFCGSAEIVYGQYEHAAGPRWMVMCLDCMATIDPGYAQQRTTVRNMWNRREKV